jgi:apolipoprotein N-acyltransferase
LYLAGYAFWLATIHWLRLPHPLVYLGWLALSAYLAVYLPLFVGLSRVAVHRLRVPLWLAAPVVWTGLELARAHIMTGFLMASLAHTQVGWLPVIQISDLFGEYGVDFLMVLVAGSIAQVGLRFVDARQGDKATRRQGDPSTSGFSLSPLLRVTWSLLPAASALAAALIYGYWRLGDVTTPPGSSSARIALIQGNSLADWKFDQARQRQIMEDYVRLSHQAVASARAAGDGRRLDLVVWPETMFRVPLFSFDEEFQLPAGMQATKDDLAAAAPQELGRLVGAIGAPALVGIDRLKYQGSGFRDQSSATDSRPSPEPRTLNPTSTYNSAVLVGRAGQIVGTYDKFHLVMFGEYVPFSKWLPFLKRITSLTGSVDAGAGPVSLLLDDTVYSPNICYETVIPHVIRRQANTLHGGSRRPDVLVNMTNDAWYWGSSELEQHLACGVFRAIETRRPLVIAANGGISAWIDHTGHIRAQSPKQQPDVIIADVEKVSTASWYMQWGDWFAATCLTGCVILAVVGWKTGSR